MNPYLQLSRIEFPVTYFCTGRCAHCSVEAGPASRKKAIDPGIAVRTVEALSRIFPIESVMAFGGEPLLYPDTACAIFSAASRAGIPSRQLITNGYFSKNPARINDVAKHLKESGVNCLLLSIDTFHAETIPEEPVFSFVQAVLRAEIPDFFLHPAWVVDRAHQNEYNRATEDVLAKFSALGIPVSDGNNIFPAGNAARTLSGFYPKKPFDLHTACGAAPYTQRPDAVQSLSVNPNGDAVVCCVPIGNLYERPIEEILEQYDPYQNPIQAALLSGGVAALAAFAQTQGISCDPSQYYNACGVCRKLVAELSAKK